MTLFTLAEGVYPLIRDLRKRPKASFLGLPTERQWARTLDHEYFDGRSSRRRTPER